MDWKKLRLAEQSRLSSSPLFEIWLKMKTNRKITGKLEKLKSEFKVTKKKNSNAVTNIFRIHTSPSEPTKLRLKLIDPNAASSLSRLNEKTHFLFPIMKKADKIILVRVVTKVDSEIDLRIHNNTEISYCRMQMCVF